MVAEGTSRNVIGLYVVYNVIITILNVKCLSKQRGIYINTFRYSVQGYTSRNKYHVILLVRGVYSHMYKLRKNIKVFPFGVCGYRKFNKLYLPLSLCKRQCSTNICF